ncbi:hypothetical protein DFH28DRAFT_352480 [Melampsora americana]|nr:hypothetical protein DFH28DRAFT_352480 [Melampsora americana]
MKKMTEDHSKNLIKVIDQSFNINSNLHPNLNQTHPAINTNPHPQGPPPPPSSHQPQIKTSSSKSKSNNKKHPRSISPEPTLNAPFIDQTSNSHSQNFQRFLNQNTTKVENTKNHQIKLNQNGSEYNLDSRAEKLKNVIERQNQQLQTIQTQISLLDQFCPTSAYSLSQNSNQQTRLNQSSDSNHHMHSNQFSTSNNLNSTNHHSTITPKPRPSLPTRVFVGYPLRDPSPGHDPTIPKAIAPVGLNPSMEEIINCPQRGEQAHSISFLLNPTMNPAKENIRALTPPPSSYNNLSPSNSHQLNQNVDTNQHHHRRPSDQPTVNSERSQQGHETSTTGGKAEHTKPQSVSTIPLSRRTVPIPGSGYRNPSGRSPNEPMELRANDLIGTGRVTCNHAQAYWDLFFQKHSNRLTWCQTDPEVMDSIRSVSDLLLASVLSVSAKVLGHHAILETCLDEAKTLTRCTMFPTRNHNYHDLKGIMILAIYHGTTFFFLSRVIKHRSFFSFDQFFIFTYVCMRRYS